MPVLYLVPNLLSDVEIDQVIPKNVLAIVFQLKQFIVEDLRNSRRFLSKIRHPVPIDQLTFHALNEHTGKSEIASLLPFLQKEDTGIISECGVPSVADPGADLVQLAHEDGIKVIPLVGPSSVLLALMASGLNGQSFAFVGYIPVKQNERILKLHELEKRSAHLHQTQIFIETPYRNMQMLNDILKNCRPSTRLTIAADITGANEFIQTHPVAKWKGKIPDIQKIPTVFLLQA